IVTMSSYAPLLANVGLKAWNPDLIYFDGSRVAGTPSYHVQKLFASHRPTEVVASTATSTAPTSTKFPSGGIGVGTWITQAEFKDIEITENGVTKSIPVTSLQRERGEWTVENGIAKQTSLQERCRMFFPMPNSSTYKLKLKGRKLGGDEGFLISVGHQSPDTWVWLNLGGWKNAEHGIEVSGSGRMGRNLPGKIETGKWYDIEIDYSPTRIICKLDGKQIFDEGTPSYSTFFQTAGIDRKTNELVVKLVNGANEPRDLQVNVGNTKLNRTATLIELAHNNPMAENSLDNPWNVAPKSSKAKVTNGVMSLPMKANSLIIARIKL
ncbi:MAG TPA: alpha-L-arabinofuranosidase C-terminal domain-containing protein, partial [Fimbriimonas sp.]|nr:alpha-L-arabinofuranosidase C-terminal domain-containing protein [Fimbriimonas sp.]